MSKLQSILEDHATKFGEAIIASLTDQIRAEVIAELKTKSLGEILAMSGGGGGVGNGAPAVAKRGPGRPKGVTAKVAAPKAAAPKAAGPKPKKLASGRLARRGPSEIAKTLGDITALLAKHPNGLRSEQIGAQLGLDRKEIPRPISDGLASGALSKTGQKRSTVYKLAGATAAKKGLPKKKSGKN